ncbi:MAG: hypothetical protein ACRC8E_01845, partial [Plesiomonas shigelloides]
PKSSDEQGSDKQGNRHNDADGFTRSSKASNVPLIEQHRPHALTVLCHLSINPRVNICPIVTFAT